jgi:ferritin-like metal-binding protein YciE
MYVVRTIISSYEAISPVKTCAAMKGMIASSELLFNTRVAANAAALDAALICVSLDIVHHELARLERLRLCVKAPQIPAIELLLRECRCIRPCAY